MTCLPGKVSTSEITACPCSLSISMLHILLLHIVVFVLTVHAGQFVYNTCSLFPLTERRYYDPLSNMGYIQYNTHDLSLNWAQSG